MYKNRIQKIVRHIELQNLLLVECQRYAIKKLKGAPKMGPIFATWVRKKEGS